MNYFCVKCGSQIDSKDSFCTKCGSATIIPKPNPQHNQSTSKTGKSPFWYLLPLLLGLVGGIIAYFILRNSDKQKAKRALMFGVILSIPSFVWIIFTGISGAENPFYVVASGSMSPVLSVYDVIVINGNEPFSEIVIGDIIVFDRPADHSRVIVQRVVSIIDDNPQTVRTQGDANPASIPGTDFPITSNEYIGKVAYVLPQVGYVTQLLKPPMNYVGIIMYVGMVLGILKVI